VPDLEIAQVIFDQTGKTITDRSLCTVRQLIKKDSYHWYSQLREGEFEFIHEFRERVNEILWLQKKHHEIIDSPSEPTTNKQSSLAELHRLTITLSNLIDVAPSIGIYNNTLPTSPESKPNSSRDNIIV